MEKNILKAAHKALEDKFGLDIIALDISQISIMTDYFFIATSKNKNQSHAMVDEVIKELEKLGVYVKHMEGYNNGTWILVDFGDIIVHVFDKESRVFYNLERIWGDAKRVQI